MSELPTRQELFDVGRQYILRHSKRITPEMVETAGSDINIYNGAVSYFGQAVISQAGQRFNALIQAGSDGDDLTRLGFDRYQLNPVGAQPAYVFVTFQRKVSGTSGVISSQTYLQAKAGIIYITVDDAVFTTSTLKVENVLARAVNAGKDFQIGANKIFAPVFPAELFDTSITVSNPEGAFILGQDSEANDIFRERIYNFWATVVRGTLKAIEQGALTVPGITRATAVEALTNDTNGFLKPARVVQLFVANDSGIITQALVNAVYEALEEYRAAGIAVLITPGVPQLINLRLRLHFIPGIHTSSLVEQIKASFMILINGLAPNKPLYRSALLNILAQYADQGLFVDTTDNPLTSAVVEPAGDLTPQPSRSIRVSRDTITVEIV